MAKEVEGLFPVIDLDDFIEDDEEYEQDYKPSPKWDLEKGDFVRNGANSTPYEDGIEAIKIWCIKTIHTERYECMAYDEDYGSELSEAMSEEDEETVELSLERTIKEALEENPRIESVDDFEFSWDSGIVNVSFVVYLVDFDSFAVETSFDGDAIGDNEAENESDDSDDSDEDDTDEADEE